MANPTLWRKQKSSLVSAGQAGFSIGLVNLGEEGKRGLDLQEDKDEADPQERQTGWFHAVAASVQFVVLVR